MSLAEYGLHLIEVYEDTIADGDGIRYSFYLAGCRHACPHCHNPQSWDSEAGQLLTDELLEKHIQRILKDELLAGITLTGGDPFYNPRGLLALLRIVKERTQMNIWCYTGYTIEKLAQCPELLAPLEYIDVLVDGPFIQAIREEDLRIEAEGGEELRFRGSSNQRIIRNPFALVLALRTETEQE